MKSIASREKIIRFSRLIQQTYGLPLDDLIAIVHDKARYSVRYRAAALRSLVCSAPLAVTQGRTYAVRRRLVRKHYAI